MFRGRSANFVRTLSSYAVMALVSVLFTSNATAEHNSGVTITIHAVQSKVKSEMPIKIIVSVTNTSKDFISVIFPEQGHAEEMVNLEVRNKRGKRLQRIDFHTVMVGGKPIRWPDNGLRGGSNPLLDPSQTWTATATLNHLFNMSKPGKYTVSADGPWMSIDGFGGGKLRPINVRSNIVTITVIPKR